MLYVVLFLTSRSPCSAHSMWTVLAVPQGATHTQEYYQGCLRNFKINGVIVDWHSTADLYDVHISGCPISDS